MAYLTRKQISDLTERLQCWNSPAAVDGILAEARKHLGPECFFRQAGLMFLRDAWIGARFGAARKALEVRLVPDEWPDFELRFSSSTEQFEATEADHPGRRRGLEYSEAEGLIHYPEEDWQKAANDASRWLSLACRRKIEKAYSSKVGLVIYLNLMEFGTHRTTVESSIPAATSCAKASFNSVWVLWQNRIYRAWS